MFLLVTRHNPRFQQTAHDTIWQHEWLTAPLCLCNGDGEKKRKHAHREQPWLRFTSARCSSLLLGMSEHLCLCVRRFWRPGESSEAGRCLLVFLLLLLLTCWFPKPPPLPLVGELEPNSTGLRRNLKKKKRAGSPHAALKREGRENFCLTDLKERYQGRLQHSATLYLPVITRTALQPLSTHSPLAYKCFNVAVIKVKRWDHLCRASRRTVMRSKPLAQPAVKQLQRLSPTGTRTLGQPGPDLGRQAERSRMPWPWSGRDAAVESAWH